jgi:3-hydroxyisobutyrate dehydrogenase
VEASRKQAKADDAAVVNSASASVKAADVVITMPPAGKHVVSVWSEIIPWIGKGAFLIDCSTINVENAKQAHALAAKHGVASVEALVSGGAGQAAKICNNMTLGSSMIAVSEAFGLAEKPGPSHMVLFDVASTSLGQCWAPTSYCPVLDPVSTSPANNDYKPGFTASLMSKDLLLAKEAAGSAYANIPLGVHAASICQSYDDAGYGGADFSGVVKFLRHPATLQQRVGDDNFSFSNSKLMQRWRKLI